MADDQDITPAILLQHMQGMEQRLRTEFRTAIATSENRLRNDIEKNGGAIAELRHDLQRVERNLSTQIANMDARLDDLEIVQVPLLKKAVGIGGKAGR